MGMIAGIAAIAAIAAFIAAAVMPLLSGLGLMHARPRAPHHRYRITPVTTRPPAMAWSPSPRQLTWCPRVIMS